MPPEPAGRLVATAHVSCRDGRLTWTSAPPVVLRRTGRRRVHLVQVGGGPLGGDALGLDVDVGPGEELELRTAAATVVQRGPNGGVASFALRARLGAGASLRWCPGPTVVTATARWHATTTVTLEAGARLHLTEQLVLGRHGQRGGHARSELTIDTAGRPLLATATVIDDTDPAHRGPGGTGGTRSVGTLVDAGDDVVDHEEAGEEPGVIWARSPLDGPGAMLTALGEASAVAAVLERGRGAGAASPPAP